MSTCARFPCISYNISYIIVVSYKLQTLQVLGAPILCQAPCPQVESYVPLTYVLRSASGDTFQLEVTQETCAGRWVAGSCLLKRGALDGQNCIGLVGVGGLEMFGVWNMRVMFIYFFIQLGMSSSYLTHIFQRARAQPPIITNQIATASRLSSYFPRVTGKDLSGPNRYMVADDSETCQPAFMKLDLKKQLLAGLGGQGWG